MVAFDPPILADSFSKNHRFYWYFWEKKSAFFFLADEQKSEFCMKSKAYHALEKLLENTKSNHVILSYSSDGLMAENEIEEIFLEYLDSNSFIIEKIPYRRFKRD